MKLFLIFLTGFQLFYCKQQSDFVKIDDGFYFKKIVSQFEATYYVLKIDLKKYKFKILNVKSPQSVETFAKDHNLICAFNGNFFTPEYKVLGLQISDHTVLNKLRKVDWGVFYVKNKKARIVHQSSFKMEKGIEFAVEAGPRLIVNGRVLKLKHQFAKRTAIGIDSKGYVYVIVTDSGVYLDEFAKFLKENLGLKEALNLDGGSSSQFYLNYKDVFVSLKSFAKIPSIIGVYKRQNEKL